MDAMTVHVSRSDSIDALADFGLPCPDISKVNFNSISSKETNLFVLFLLLFLFDFLFLFPFCKAQISGLMTGSGDIQENKNALHVVF